MCLAEFASHYRIVYGKETEDCKRFRLLNNMGMIQKRTRGKPAIIRYARFSEKKDPENFYGRLLKLYLPHRSESSLKTEMFPTHQEFYKDACVRLPGAQEICAVTAIVTGNQKKFEQHNKIVEQVLDDFLKNGPVEDAWNTFAPEAELDKLECLEERIQGEPLHENEQDDVPEFTRCKESGGIAVAVKAPEMSRDSLLKMYRNLNRTQACTFYSVCNWCINLVRGLNPDPFFYFVTGGAGTGKSHLIKCVYAEATKILRNLPRLREEADISMPMVLLTAFTGTASFNISGNTLHSVLKLPRSLKPPYQGLGNLIDEVRAQLSNAQIIIIDEVSMISKALFAYVNWRLQQIKGSKKPFGGMSVLAVGDFYQVPPLGKSKPLCVFEEDTDDFWKDYFQMITLTEIMRQRDDVAFAELLNRIRVKQKMDPLSNDDKALLDQALTDPSRCPNDVLHIFATNKEVHKHNAETVSVLHANVTNIDADDYKKDPKTGVMQRQLNPSKGQKDNLLDTLQAAEGARIMITRNIDVEDGLVNGTFGKIARIITKTEKGSTTVNMLGLVLDNPNAGQRYRNKLPGDAGNLVYIERVEENLRQKGVVRRQFPVRLAFACTIHKVQGMTTQSAVVSLKRVFQTGMAYVALSRTTSLQGLHITDFDEKKIFADPEITASLDSMKKASVDSAMPLFKYLQTTNKAQTLTIIHHNTEGLPAHIEDIKSHHELTLGDVLCFTETHLSGSFVAESLQLDGYSMFRRNRHLSYTNLPHIASRSGGGVALYVRNYYQASEKPYLQNVTDLEFLVVKLESPVQALIAVVYRPPDYSIGQFLLNLQGLLESLEVMNCQPVILCGDFNEDLLSSAKKPISNMLHSRGYTQLVKAATTDKNTSLDHIYISRVQHCLQSGVLHTYHSYHNPVYCVLNPNCI
ncbi:hypothetical protein DPEC_G00063670 [Dallia pectoralis]|uniref:Uncharacterized protein n=1 Tax=Dallia pectoralis TaxID=75939 RepID=A0ACC2H7G1_DALPE|nr:hypothetical protein DPEC_G00063670 [Dallia pectoralis]